MELQTLIDKLANTQPLMRGLQTQIRTVYNQALLAQVKVRVQQRGINARNTAFKPYSTRPALLGYSDYPLNKKAYSRLKSQMKKINKAEGGGYGGWVTINGHSLMIVPGGYKAIRNAAGYQIAHKDFTVTNAMWRSVKVFPPRIRGTVIEFGYGATNPKEALKIIGHDKREGVAILEPTKQELENVQANIVNYLEEMIGNIFNA